MTTAFTATVKVIRALKKNIKYEGRLGKNPAVCDRVVGDVVLFFGGGLKLYWKITKVTVYNSVSSMMHDWGFKKFVPWVTSFEDALLLYYSLYSESKITCIEDAYCWDKAVCNSPLKFYAWQGKEVPDPKVELFFI